MPAGDNESFPSLDDECCASYAEMSAWASLHMASNGVRSAFGMASDIPEELWQQAMANLLARGVLIPCEVHPGRYRPGDYDAL